VGEARYGRAHEAVNPGRRREKGKTPDGRETGTRQGAKVGRRTDEGDDRGVQGEA